MEVTLTLIILPTPSLCPGVMLMRLSLTPLQSILHSQHNRDTDVREGNTMYTRSLFDEKRTFLPFLKFLSESQKMRGDSSSKLSKRRPYQRPIPGNQSLVFPLNFSITALIKGLVRFQRGPVREAIPERSTESSIWPSWAIEMQDGRHKISLSSDPHRQRTCLSPVYILYHACLLKRGFGILTSYVLYFVLQRYKKETCEMFLGTLV